MIILNDRKDFTIQVQIRGANRGADGKRQNTVNQITVLDSTVEEVTKIVRAALESHAKQS